MTTPSPSQAGKMIEYSQSYMEVETEIPEDVSRITG